MNFYIEKIISIAIIIISFCTCKVSNINLNTRAVININDFGAIPNDGIDDSKAMQNAIDFALSSQGTSFVYIPPGVYDLYRGIVVANFKENDNMHFVTLTISGQISAFASHQSIGKTSVLKLHNAIFGIAIQKARNCVIENLVFEGCAKYTNDSEKIFNWTKEDWGERSNAVMNKYSPSCGIAIDPFHINVPRKDRYLGLDKFYEYSSNGGSSMVIIRGCSFFNHYIAIANNPSNGVQNGDNIRAEHCHVSTCHTFWSAGQTQSRANSIENVYALFLHSFVSGTQIGSQQGTPPTISNVNLAGFCKYVFDIKTGFSGLNLFRSYMESIWSLGVSNGNSTSFDQCHFQFRIPDEKIPTPPFHLYSDKIVALRDCSIEYFNNCNSPIPFLFRSQELIVTGGMIEGGVIVADGITNAGGDDLHKVKMEGVFIKCLNKVAGSKSTQKPESKVKNEIILGGEIVITNEGDLALNQGTTYNLQYLETLEINSNSAKGQIVFKSDTPNDYSKGNNIFSDHLIRVKDLNIGEFTTRTYLGYVDKKDGNLITLLGVPLGITSGKHPIYKVSFPIIDIKNNRSNNEKKIIIYRRK